LFLRRVRLQSGRFSNFAIRIAVAFNMVSGLTLLSYGLARDAAASTYTLCSPPVSPEVSVVSHPTR
jgi:hypothetical protein